MRRMVRQIFRTVIMLIALLAPGPWSSLPAAEPRLLARETTIGPGELTPGMTGYGLSVFKGDTPERFPVRFVDVVPGTLPGRKMLLVKAGNGEEFTKGLGFGSGFSGSPVYFDGRLAGAISQMESYQTDMLLRVTLIEDMLQTLAPAQESCLGLATILPKNPEPLSPGGMIAIPMLRGDIELGSTGSVTAVSDGVVLAFGHENNFWGDSVVLPMHAARVNGIIQKLDLSHKQCTTLEEIGAVVWDGKEAVVGRVGVKAPMIPFGLTYRQRGEQEPKKYQMEMVRHTRLIPLLTATAVAKVVDSTAYKRYEDEAVAVTCTLTFADREKPVILHRRWGLDLIRPSEAELNKSPLGKLLQELLYYTPDPAALTAIAIGVEELADGKSARLTGATFATTVARPGDKVLLNVELRHGVAERMVVPVEIEIPIDYTDELFPVLVASGSEASPVGNGPSDLEARIRWHEGQFRVDDLVVLHPGARSGGRYADSGMTRQVVRVPWEIKGKTECRIEVKAE